MEQSVVVRYPLTGTGFGTGTEREAVYALRDRLSAAIEAHGAGEYGGHEFGEGEVLIFAYGPDASRLFAAMEETLREFPPRPAYARLRSGDDTERRIDL